METLAGLCVAGWAHLAIATAAGAAGTGVRPDEDRLPDLALERKVAALVSEERAMQNVRELVELGPRMGGTESGIAAASWLLSTFQEARIPTQLLLDPETWCHTERSWSLVATAPGAEPLTLASAWPWGFSPSAAGTATLSLEPRAGSALLVGTYPPFTPRDARPVVMLVDGEATLDGRYPVLRHLRSGDRNPFPVFGLSRPDGERLRALAEDGAETEIAYALDAVIEKASPRTVVARIRACEGAEPGFVLFCAHGDSDAGGPGANDNASGEAIVIEVATAWSRAVREGLVPAPPRELRFAIWGKEIHSSRAYLQQHLPAEEDAPPLLGVVNFDQSGFGSGADQLYIEPDDVPGNRGLIAQLLAVLEDHSGHEGFPERWATNGSLGGTDSYVFSDSKEFVRKRRPAVLLYTSAWGTPRDRPRTEGMRGESWRDRETVSIDHDVHYHSSGDTPENTTDREPWNMGWHARVALLGTMRWLEALERR